MTENTIKSTYKNPILDAIDRAARANRFLPNHREDHGSVLSYFSLSLESWMKLEFSDIDNSEVTVNITMTTTGNSITRTVSEVKDEGLERRFDLLFNEMYQDLVSAMS